MKKEIQHASIAIGLSILFSLTGCTAVPTGDRYSQDDRDQNTIQEAEKTRDQQNVVKPSLMSINYEKVFSGYGDTFVKIPEKVQSVTKTGLYWYRFSGDPIEESSISETDGFTLQVFSSESEQAADSVATLLFEKTGINEISVELTGENYQVFYGGYPDFSTAAEAVIKLNEKDFKNCLPVPGKIRIRKKY